MSDPLIGKVIADGRYEILEKLGEGAMGEVYRARQVAVGRMVALKLIHSAAVRSPDTAARFQREMKLSAKIEHANTIRVYDFGSSEGQLYLAMELVRGKSLRAELEQHGPLPLARIVRVGAQIARALSAAHAEDVVHRDLKPDNVMLVEQYGERDLVKVLDFGIAKSLSEPEEARMTGAGAIIGTPQYMSPEQAMGQRVDERSDLYALGIILFEMAAGRVPFDAPSITAVLVAHTSEPPPALESLIADVHPGLAQLVAELLRKDANTRPRSAQEVEARLLALAPAQTARRLSSMTPAEGDQAPVSGDAAAPTTTRGLLWVMLLSALFGGAAAAWLWVRDEPRAGPPSTAAPYVLPAIPTPPVLDPAPHPPAPWELETVRVAVTQQLNAAGLPLPPSECASEAGVAAAAHVLLAQQRLAQDAAFALNAATQAVEQCPSWSVAHNLRGNALQSLGELDQAVTAYREALRIAPLYDAPQFNLGVVQLRRKDPEAIATFSALIAEKPNYPDVYKSRAQAYLFAERYREGLSDLEQAVKQDPSDGTAWLMVAQLRERLNRPDAKGAYCRASELNVESARARCTH